MKLLLHAPLASGCSYSDLTYKIFTSFFRTVFFGQCSLQLSKLKNNVRSFLFGLFTSETFCWRHCKAATLLIFSIILKKTCKKFLCTRIQSFVDWNTIILILFSGKKIKTNWRFKKVKASSRTATTTAATATTKRFCFFYQRQLQQKSFLL